MYWIRTFIFVIISSVVTFRQNDYYIKHNYAVIDYYNSTIFRNPELKNVKPNRTFRAYSLSGHLLVDVVEEKFFMVRLKGYKFINNIPSHTIYQFDVNGCKVRQKDTFGLNSAILKVGNITKCPMRKGFYYVNNFMLKDQDLPPLLPAGRYRLEIILFYDGYTMGSGSIYAEFKQDDYIIKHDHATVEYYNTSFLRNLELKNVKPNRTYRAYTISGQLLQDIPDNNLFRVKLKAFKFASNVPSHNIFELDVCACDAVSKNRFGVTDLLVAGNVTKCPVKQGYYYVKNYNIDDRNLPPYIPNGRYRLQLIFTYGSVMIAKGSLYAEVIYKVKHWHSIVASE